MPNARTGMDPDSLKAGILDHLHFTKSKERATATLLDVCHAVSHAARDRLVQRWMVTQRAYHEAGQKRAYYLSAEYLLGRQLAANLHSLGIFEATRTALDQLGFDLDEVLEQEEDPGLGNGGLGRLAACYMESAATLELPLMGYGIRYEFGIFRQAIENGWQIEHPDEWLKRGNPWEIPRPERSVTVGFGGRVDQYVDNQGHLVVTWRPETRVVGVPFDTPVAGHGPDNHTVNTLRLWSARASEDFDLAVFNDGDYRRAVEQKALSESISKVLYPKDHSIEGKELRLKQQYFFVACALHDLLRRFTSRHGDDWSQLPERVAIQLNDTHPAIAVAELMRLLVDVHDLSWERAWELVRATIAYTNHTLLPEALERWPQDLFARLLPRHHQIIAEIDRRFADEVHVHTGGNALEVDRLRILGDHQVRMAHLSVVGSFKVNGVAELHSKLLTERTLASFARLYPDRFTNVTNGVTPRRWLLQCNQPLYRAIADRIGEGFLDDLGQLEQLLPLAEDADFLARIEAIKRGAKQRLVAHIHTEHAVTLPVDALFDVQVKRIHEYKRQLMCALHVVDLYRRAKFEGERIQPRVVLIGGKAAPGYARAKQHIKLINDIARVVNHDKGIGDLLKLYFLPNYNVSFAERVIPAADLSEQISMAGKEASGTGNMKFQLNGAVTMGTLDGANIEIREEVGPENFFLFGLDADEVAAKKRQGYVPGQAIARSPSLQAALDLLESGYFNREDAGVHREVVRYLKQEDPYLVCEDFEDYLRAQAEADAAFADPERWWPMVVRNIARAGKFSSDRSVSEYAERIWNIVPQPIAAGPIEEPTHA